MKVLISFFALFLTGTLVQGQTGVSLLDNSPFMPPEQLGQNANNKNVGPASLARLQLRGITSIGGQYIFSVYNPDTRESKWLSEGVEEDGLLIQSYNPEGNTVVIRSEAENLTRQMEMNDFAAPSAIRSPIPTPLPSTAGRPPVTPAQISPTGTALSLVNQTVQRPTRRNLETLRERREELAEKLRKTPKPEDTNKAPPPGGTGNGQPNGGNR